MAAGSMVPDVSLSIVVPVYNHAAFLERSLGAIAAQTVPPHDVIVVDDASTDGSAEAAERFRSLLEPRTRLVVSRNSVNLGVNDTLNRGLRLASGTWVCCTGADDWLEPAYVEAMSQAATLHAETDVVTSTYVEHFEAEDRTVRHDRRSEMGVWYAEGDSAYLRPSDLLGRLKQGHIAIPVSASLMRMEALRSAGGFDAALKWHADWFVAYALALRHGLAVVARPLATFRIAPGTLSSSNVRDRERQRDVCGAILGKLDQPEWVDVRAALLRAPSPFAPFVRHMLPAMAAGRGDRDLFRATALWWLGEALRGRRPGPVRRLATALGIDVAPRI